MLRRLALLGTICLLTFVHVVSAQTETATAETFPTFPVEQRCIPLPTAPPKGWTYPGMILMSGYAGIHAMEAGWSTPHVVAAMHYQDVSGNVPIDGEQLSPDENWYAVPMGDVIYEQSLNQIWEMKAVRVFSLSGDGKVLNFNLGQRVVAQITWIYFPVVWHDNQTFTTGGFQMNLRDGRISASDFFGGDLAEEPATISPDLTRAYGDWATQNKTGLGLYTIENPVDSVSLGNLDYVSWQRDSTGFMAETRDFGETEAESFDYYRRDGNRVDHMAHLGGSLVADQRPLSGRSELQWSPDDRYFAFVQNFYPDSQPNDLMLVDMQQQTIIDTCIAALNAPVWSPDGTMFAFLTKAPQNLYLVVVDVKNWEAYVVAQQSGLDFSQSYFSSDPEMVGWRSTAQDQ